MNIFVFLSVALELLATYQTIICINSFLNSFLFNLVSAGTALKFKVHVYIW